MYKKKVFVLLIFVVLVFFGYFYFYKKTNYTKSNFSFGVHPASLDNYNYAKDLKLNINREGMYFIWDFSDVEKNGSFKFKNVLPPNFNNSDISQIPKIDYDRDIKRLISDRDIKYVGNICPFNLNEFKNSKEKEVYQKYVEKVIERYDGDNDFGCIEQKPDCYKKGDKEYPDISLLEATKNNPVKYWQVCNQLMDTCLGEKCLFKKDYITKFAEVQKLTYISVKNSCSECEVAIGGDSPKDLYPDVYKILDGKYIDIIDIHFVGNEFLYKDIIFTIDYLKKNLGSSGFNLNNLKFWITEVGTYSGKPIERKIQFQTTDKEFLYQNESQQAKGLIKIFVTAFSEDVDTVLWAWGIKEGFKYDCEIYDYTGLIYDGNKKSSNCSQNDFYDRGDGIKKLSYYSYKLLIEKMKNTQNVEIVEKNSDIYIYKFKKYDGNIVYVAWSEKEVNKILKDISYKKVKITESVAKYDSGESVLDYNSAFDVVYEDVINGSLELKLNSVPIFIEEL